MKTFNYLISCKQNITTSSGKVASEWAYLCKENGPFGDDWFFSAIGGTPYRFPTVRKAQKTFKSITENLLRQYNLSDFDFSTLSIRKICYKDMAKLELIIPEKPDTEIHVGDYCVSRDDLWDVEGVVTQIYDNGMCTLEFAIGFGACGGGSICVRLEDLIPRRAVK
jgi:hypothetical protein